MKSLRNYFLFGLCGVLIFCTLSVLYTVYQNRSHALRFVMLDIGQGDALYIEAPNGNKVLVDGGPGDALLGQLSKVMSPFDRTIDMIIKTTMIIQTMNIIMITMIIMIIMILKIIMIIMPV